MKRSRSSEEQIIAILREQESGRSPGLTEAQRIRCLTALRG